MNDSPLFTHIIFAWRPDLLPRSMDAVLNQTYKNLEIILVDHCPAQDNVEIGKKISDMVDEYAAKDKRIRVLRFNRFPFSLDNPTFNYDYGCKKAVQEMSRGKYFMIQNDDDYLSPNYIEVMVHLFEKDAECISAAGLPIAVNLKGESVEGPRLSNYRPRYMPGHILTLDHHAGGNMFSAPGLTVCAWKKSAYLDLGGFSPASDNRHLYGIIPFGKTAFDDSAQFFWVRHEGQFNKALSSRGWVSTKENIEFYSDWKIEQKWERFGIDLARKLVKECYERTYRYAATWFAINFWRGHWIGCYRLTKSPALYSFTFWSSIPKSLFLFSPFITKIWNKRQGIGKKLFYTLGMGTLLKPLFILFPKLPERSPFFARIQKKISH